MNTIFERQVQDYIALRRGLGSRLNSQEKVLLDFGRFLDQFGYRGPITTEIALKWSEAPQSKDPSRTAQRLGTIRGFLRHRSGFDPKTEVPATKLLGCGIRRKPPHIYTLDEERDLLHACSKLRPCEGLRPHTFETLFSLLFATGLRISEALNLKDHDVDFNTGVLTVRDSKFGKSRLVPLHSSALQPLINYVTHRDEVAPNSPSFFRTDNLSILPHYAARTAFDRLRERLKWTVVGRARRPRIMDIRHTFATRCLLRWYQNGIHPDRKIAHLATYLGHTEVRDTYWYLSAVPELSALAIERFELFAKFEQGGDHE